MQVSITPKGFPGSPIAGMAERYGDRLAHGIQQTGAQIEASLQKMTTNRQLQSLTTALSQISPETPDYPQQVMALTGTGQYMEALRDPRGQSFLMMGGAAHRQWMEGQRAQQQANQTFGRQMALENLRTENDIKLEGIRGKNRIGAGIDLSEVNLDLPERANPAANVGTSMLSGGASNIAQEEDEPIPMTGLRGGMRDVARTVLGEIQEEQRLAPGLKYTPAQINSRINSTLSRENQRIQQEDRQAQQFSMQDRREAKADEKIAKTDERTATKDEQAAVRAELSIVESDIKSHRSALNGFLSKMAGVDTKKWKESDFARKAELEATLQGAGEERTRLMGLIKGEEKKLSKDEAAAILKEAAGDKEKARALARERGFTL